MLLLIQTIKCGRDTIGYRVLDTDKYQVRILSEPGYKKLSKEYAPIINCIAHEIDIEDIYSSKEGTGNINKWWIVLGKSGSGLPVVLDMYGNMREVMIENVIYKRLNLKFEVIVPDEVIKFDKSAKELIGRLKILDKSMNLDTMGDIHGVTKVIELDECEKRLEGIRGVYGTVRYTGNNLDGFKYLGRLSIRMIKYYENIVIEDCDVLDSMVLTDGTDEKAYSRGIKELLVRNVDKMQLDIATFKVGTLVLDNIKEILIGEDTGYRETKPYNVIKVRRCGLNVFKELRKVIEKYEIRVKLDVEDEVIKSLENKNIDLLNWIESMRE